MSLRCPISAAATPPLTAVYRASADSHHLARIGKFAEMAAAEGFISIHFTNHVTESISNVSPD